MNLSFFSSRAWLRHALYAMWILLLAWLVIEWSLPGTISAELPVFAVASVMIFCTLFFGAQLTRIQSRFAAFIGFVLPVVAVMLGGALFAMREESSLIKITTALAIALGGLTIFAFFINDSP